MKSNYPVISVYSEITGNKSVSSGLTHSFSEIIRFNFRKSLEYNPYGIRIFLFFLIQLFFRINFLLIMNKGISDSSIVIADIALSAGVFLIAFWPFLVSAVKAIP